MSHTAYSLIFNFMLENCGPKPFSSSKLGRLFFIPHVSFLLMTKQNGSENVPNVFRE